MISFPISYQPAFMYSLSKAERLCSKILFEELLTSEISFVKYPFREAYRLNKPEFYQHIIPGHTVDILFIYLDQNLPVFSKTEKAIKSVLKKIPSLLSSVS